MILFCPLQQAEQYAAFTACGFILALRQTVSAPLLLPGFHCNHNSESSWEILSSLGSISQINECDKTAWIRNPPPLSITHEKAEVKRDVIVFHILAVCVQWHRYVLIMSRVWYSSVHSEFVAFHLVELVSGVGVLTWPDHRGSNIQILVKILPAHLTWMDTHTHTHIRHISNQRYPQMRGTHCFPVSSVTTWPGSFIWRCHFLQGHLFVHQQWLDFGFDVAKKQHAAQVRLFLSNVFTSCASGHYSRTLCWQSGAKATVTVHTPTSAENYSLISRS